MRIHMEGKPRQLSWLIPQLCVFEAEGGESTPVDSNNGNEGIVFVGFVGSIVFFYRGLCGGRIINYSYEANRNENEQERERER